MNIGIIQSIIGGGGGNDKVLISLLKKLKETDHIVSIYTVSEPRIDLSKYKIKKIKKLISMKIPAFGIYQKLLEPALAKKAQNEDVLIALTGDLFLPNNTKQRMIFYSQNNYSDPEKSNTSKYKTGLWKFYYMPYHKMQKNMIKNFKKYNIEFISNSNYVKEQLKTNLDVDSKVIYPPVELDKFPYSPQRQDGIISVGRFSKEKNFDKIIDLIKDFPIPKRLFGSLSETNRAYYQSLINQGKPHNVTFYTNQKFDLMLRLLHKSKVFISQSDETFGIAVVESMSAGCIPIVPNSTAHLETVPFEELRPTTDEEIRSRIYQIQNGDLDYLIPKIQEHIKQFDEKEFQNNFLRCIENKL